MPELLRVEDFIPARSSSRTARFDGGPHGAEASFFAVDNDPGQGPGLHWHPYSETWLVISGTVRFRLGDADGDAVDVRFEELDAAAGNIFTVPARRHHAFTATGEGPLRMVCIHASPQIIQFDLE